MDGFQRGGAESAPWSILPTGVVTTVLVAAFLVVHLTMRGAAPRDRVRLLVALAFVIHALADLARAMRNRT